MLLKETEIYKAATSVYDNLLKLGISPRDARAIVIDYATCCYATAKNWLIRMNLLIDLSTMPEAIAQVSAQPLDGFNWQAEKPLVLAQVFESCIEPQLRKKNGCVYTPEPVVLYMVRSSVQLALKNNCDPSVGEIMWSTLHLDEIAAETRIDKLMEAQRCLSRIQAVDPCCGCGNFTYGMFREITALDRAIAARLRELGESAETKVSIGQIYGVDIDPDAIEVCKRVMQFAYLEFEWQEPAYCSILPDRFRAGNTLSSEEVTDFCFK